jgi:hypothetical protein
MISNPELRSLGLLLPRGAGHKRKQPPYPQLGESKKAHMDRPNIFEELSFELSEVLQCIDHRVILDAIRALAEGKRATLLEGIMLQLLSGVGHRFRGDGSEGKYREMMSALLICISWGLRS